MNKVQENALVEAVQDLLNHKINSETETIIKMQKYGRHIDDIEEQRDYITYLKSLMRELKGS